MDTPNTNTQRNPFPRSNNNGSVHSSKRQRIGIVSQQQSNSFSGGASFRSNRSVSSRPALRKSNSGFDRNRLNRSSSNSLDLGIARAGSTRGSRRSHGHSPTPQTASTSPHILCAIGENLARETCVVSLDLSAPFLLTVTKQSNGQSYSETIACLSVLCPNEVLLNEGRYHSPLAKKVIGHFDVQRLKRQKRKEEMEREASTDRSNATVKASGKSSNADSCDDEEAVVKFISRSCFDQTKGAELLRKVARQDTYDSTLVDEYILLSSAHAVLHYAQVTLGAVAFARHSLDVRVHTGGHNHNKMEIDRSTILQLELLTNNSNSDSKSSRKESLISTIDCTKTGVGHRLLRTTLMAPPCRMDTITARLDLVDVFLQDEELFYTTLQQLQNLSSLDNMLTNIVVIPPMMQNLSRQQHQQRRQELEQRRQELGLSTNRDHSVSNNMDNSSHAARSVTKRSRRSSAPVSGKAISANERAASKGISALICIKTTLAHIPVLAAILKNHLDRIEGKDKATQRKDHREASAECPKDHEARDEATIATAKSSLLMGLGVGKGHRGSSFESLQSSASTQNQLLRAIIFALTQPELNEIREIIDEAFTKSTTFNRNANAMKHQECFALKSSNDNGIMDILRKAFLSNVDDIYKKADEYAEVHGISHVAVKYSTAKGYYLSLPQEMASNLPNEFIQPSRSGRFIFCTTEEVQSLNIRTLDNIQDLLLQTHCKIQEVLEIARSKYDALARLSDAIALLDLCHSFADKVTLSKLPWTRPTLTNGDMEAAADTKNDDIIQSNDFDDSNLQNTYAIAICNGRYAIETGDDSFPSDGGPGQWIANDTYASLSKNLTVISGINGSGKSTYLKQIAMIVLLAHCGSYVPAEQALIPLTNRLCARMMTADDQEHNISSFMLEMKETAFICKNATSRSLILLDELGRATSNEDGVAIAWAVAENLLAKGAMTYFVTHYPQLCQMSKTYPSVQNQHMKASISDDGEGKICYSHKIGRGPCDATSNYGVDMAVSCGWPSDVVEEARAIESSLKDKLAEVPLCGEDKDIETEIRQKKILKSVAEKLVNSVTSEGGPTMDLQALKVSLLEEMNESDVLRWLDRSSNDNDDK